MMIFMPIGQGQRNKETGEPDDATSIPSGSEGGWEKRPTMDLARSLPYLASLDDDPEATGLPAYVQREFYAYLQCGILAHGFLRLGCDTGPKELLLPFSGKRRGFCPACAGRRMAQMAAHLVEQVIPWVPTRQWVVSVPVPLRYWMAGSQDLMAKVHTIIRTTIGQYYVHKISARGFERVSLHPGSVTFIQRFGSAL